MTLLKDLVFLLVPVIILVTGAWLYIKYYLKMEREKINTRQKSKNINLITPLRLQAYERIILLLERMEPAQLVIRNIIPGQTSLQLQQSLTSNIRDEFDHNLSQQLYISSESWNKIKNARETTIAKINEAGSKVSSDSPATDLAAIIFELDMQKEFISLSKALEFVKSEARILF